MDSIRVPYSTEVWDAALGGVKWTASNLTFSFPSAASNYDYTNDDTPTFFQLTAQQQAIVRIAYNQIAGFTNLTFTEIAESDTVHALLRHGNSTSTRPKFTSYAYYPSEAPGGGDSWYGPSVNAAPAVGDYSYSTILHEIGHSVGLKHGHEFNQWGALPTNVDGLEYSLMTYRDFVGDNTNSFDVTPGHSPQTYMMFDIAAMQYMYGADYSAAGNLFSGNTVYSFNVVTGEMSINGVAQGNASPTNTVLRTIWDGHGVDTYDFSAFTGNMQIDLRPGQWTTFDSSKLADLDGTASVKNPPGNIANALLFQGDTRSLIENATGGIGNDTIVGNQGNNVLTGSLGNDTLTGLEGQDTLNGGLGSDWAVYSEKTAAVFLQLLGASNATAFVGGVAEDTLIGIENIRGGSAGDFIYGDSNANTIYGQGGDDLIFGGGSQDVLTGGAGNDTLLFDDKSTPVVLTLNGGFFAPATVGGVLEDNVAEFENIIGGSAGDTLTGDAQANILRGAGGLDTLDGAGGSDTADFSDKTASVLVTLAGAAPIFSFVGGFIEDVIVNIESIIGGSAGDTLNGDALDNTFRGGGGADVINGGGGSDTADYSDKTASVVVPVAGGTNVAVTVGGVVEDTLTSIENIIGGSAADTLSGNTFSNVFTGMGGADVINGNGGVDTASYADKSAIVNVELNGAVASTVLVGGLVEDTIQNIENIIGGAGNDQLTGDANANRFEGGAGNDFMVGGGGADVLIGGAGLDTASYTDKTLAVVVTLAGNVSAVVSVGGVAEDTILQIENVFGGTAADTLTGDSADNVLRGFGGADTLNGGGGSDTADYFDKGGAAISVTLNGSTAVTVTVGGVAEDSIVNIENVFGAAGNDGLTGDGLANRLDGFNGDDLLVGAGGNDVLVGGFGNDTIRGGLGNDQLIGDAGIDTADFSDLTTKITTTLRVGTVVTVYSNGVAQDTMIGFENLTGGSGDDNLRGDENANVLNGNGGKDSLNGEDGADTLNGGTEDDTLGGGAGNDTLSGDAGIDKLYGDAGDDNLSGGTENDELYGGADNDTLSGDAGIDKLYGDAGEDTLSGGTQADELSGGVGNDVLSGGEGDDTISGDGGADQIDGGAGADRADYWLATGDLSVTLDGANNALVIIGGAFDDLLKNIESVISGSGNDTLSGDANNNLLQGNDGNDILNGAGGYDFLFGVEGNDVLNPGSGGGQADGGNGVDTVDMSGETLDLVATLTGATASTVTSGGASYASISNVENLIGGSGNDSLTGDGLANALSGGDGNDVLSGKGGADALDGGAGRDRADYSEKTNQISVDLDGGTTVNVQVGAFVEDTMRNVEDVTGGSGNDNLAGDQFDNAFVGGGGADTLSGRQGNDTLTGGSGNDTLFGDEGVDTAIYSEKTASIYMDLFGGELAAVFVGGILEDAIAGIENIVSGSGDDLIYGDDEDNWLDGGAGNDALNGEGGGDTLIGGSGFDTMDGGDGSDTADYSAESQILVADLDGANFVSVADNVGGSIDQIRRIENLIGGSANDLFLGDDASNRLEGRGGEDGLAGGAGDDVLKGGAGNDSMDGEGGNDTADFSDKTESVSGATGDISFVFIGATEVDTIYNIENLIGGSAADTLAGDARDNRFQGLGGADDIDGGAGNDTADYSEDGFGVFVDMTPGGAVTVEIGGSPSDAIVNIENIIGGIGGDFLFGDGLGNTFFGNDGSDTLSGGGGDDILRGGAGVDGMTGGTGVDTADYSDRDQSVVGALDGSTSVFFSVGGAVEDLIGGFENLIGGSAGDTLTGDGNDNRFKGLGGADTLDGAAGNDIADFGDKSASVVVALDGANPVVVSVGGVAEDQIVNFEGLVGGSAADQLTGDADNNLLEGGGGDDVLTGLGGNDTIDGGAGRDVVNYAAAGGSVAVTLNGSVLTSAVVGGVAEDTLRNVESVTGSAFIDILIGDTLDNTLAGLGAGDLLQGEGGQDVLIGDAGDDFLKGGDGFDYMDGGGDIDTADYGDKSLAVEIALDGGTIVQAFVGGVSEDQLLNIESLIGGSGGDTLSGDALDNRFDGNNGDDFLSGGAGNDLLLGGAGSDFMHGAAGNDTLDGGADFDWLEYRYDTLNIVVTLRGALDAIVTIDGVAQDIVRNAEGFLSGSGADRITGDSSGNVFYGENGDDILSGAAGEDYLDGGIGNDLLTGGIGNDQLNGSIGIDTASYADKTAAVVVALNGATAVNVTVGGIVEDTIFNVENVTGGTGNDALTGDTLANALNGGAGNDILNGSGGSDTLTGGTGVDQMTGGTGNDVYSVDNASDTVVELINGGFDVVNASVSFTVGDHIEVLNLTGAAVSGTGGNTANTITGTAGANILNGGGGNDTLNGGQGADAMDGGGGDDLFIVDNAGDTATEAFNAGTDTVQSSVSFTLGADIERLTLTGAGSISGTGNVLDNLILGNANANVIDGLAGADTMRGGAGNDVYRVDSLSDVVTELLNEGSADRIESTISVTLLVNNVENLTLLGASNIDATGNTLANVILGNTGNNLIDGKTGGDTMRGGAGDDTYTVDDLADTVVEITGQGTDTVRSFVSFTLVGELENLVLLGNQVIDGAGNSLANTLTGNLANNVLNGGGGADTMTGAAGNDTYIVDNVGDIVIDVSGTADQIQTSVSYTMAANIESMTLTGTLAINGTGNAGVNSINGNTNANTLSGDAGNDILSGDAGADILIGGLGLDTLTGGSAADRFRIESAAMGADTITDFTAGDLIQLMAGGFGGLAVGALAAGQFVSGLAPAATLAAAQILYDTDDGFVLFDSDGTGLTAAVRIATLAGAPVVTASAFAVIP